jgi:hypothetical protein
MALPPIDYHHLSNLYKKSAAEPVRTGDRLLLELVFDGSLDECITEFMKRSAREHHLYEVHTVLQPAIGKEILTAADLLAIGSRDDFPKE